MIPLHQGRVQAPPTSLVSPIAHLKLVANLLDTLLQALLTNVAILSKKQNTFVVSHRIIADFWSMMFQPSRS